MSESIIQTHTSSLLEGRGGGGGCKGEWEGGEGRGRKDGIKDGVVEKKRERDGEESVPWLPYQSICSIKINLHVIWTSSPTG